VSAVAEFEFGPFGWGEASVLWDFVGVWVEEGCSRTAGAEIFALMIVIVFGGRSSDGVG